jgi:hypothetical protein
VNEYTFTHTSPSFSFFFHIHTHLSFSLFQLIEEFGMDNLLEWHKVEKPEEVWDQLLDYSDEVLVDRFSMVRDSVLGERV